MLRINNIAELARWANDHGLRPDWHEPDEQGVSARVVGDHLDNAMGAAAAAAENVGELNIVLTVYGKDAAVVNLATLLSWASYTMRYGEGVVTPPQGLYNEAVVQRLVPRAYHSRERGVVVLDKDAGPADSLEAARRVLGTDNVDFVKLMEGHPVYRATDTSSWADVVG